MFGTVFVFVFFLFDGCKQTKYKTNKDKNMCGNYFFTYKVCSALISKNYKELLR